MSSQTQALESKMHIKLHLFLGCFIGATLLGIWASVGTGSPHLLYVFNTAGYPFVLIFGGIPACLTGLILHILPVESFKRSYAFFVGFCVCFLCYQWLQTTAFPSYFFKLALIGGASSFLIQCIILKKEKNIK